MSTQIITLPFDVALLPIKILQSGMLSCLYEHGKLRYIKWNNKEVLRMIYFAVRNENWETPPYIIQDERIEQQENGFFIRYTAVHQLKSLLYKADVIIKAENNALSFSVKGEALSSFKRNRIGICVLHPIPECAGKEVLITKPDGTLYASAFPKVISPHQPFKDIREIEWEIEKNTKIQLQFEGETFETEDQRNWSDSSFKTYSTPLAIPIPVQVTEDQTIEQKVELRITGTGSESSTSMQAYEEKKIPFPKVGYGRAKEALDEAGIHLFKQIPFDHYRVELYLSKSDWQQELKATVTEARQLGTSLELVAVFTDDFEKELAHFLGFLEKYSSVVNSILVLHTDHKITPRKLIEVVYPVLKSRYPHIKTGYGTDGFFAELNRNPPADLPFDFVSFSLNPQVHAADTRTIMENLECQPQIIHTIKKFIGEKEIQVSPVTFKIREDASENEEMPEDYDSRQHCSFGAFWTLAALKNLSGADRITFYQTKGYCGIINQETSASQPYTLFQLLKKIKAFNPKWIIENAPHQNPFSSGIVLENETGDRLQFVITSPADQSPTSV